MIAKIKSDTELKKCTKCGCSMDQFSISTTNTSQCRACYAAYKRDKYKEPEYKKRHSARITAYKYLKKGVLQPQNCSHCGSDHTQMHHPDYDKPIDVTWMCKRCHEDFHALENRVLYA